jgi:hypothetical protein
MPSERDDLSVQVLERLEQPVEPDPEFSNALRELLLAEVGEPKSTTTAWLRRVLAPRPRLLPAVGVVALVAVVVGAAVLALRTAEDSALAAITRAQRQAAAVPPFQAVVSHRVAGELALGTVALATGEDWVSLSELSYGGETGWHRLVLRDSVSSSSRRVVWDGRVLGIDRPEQGRFYVYSRASARGRAVAQQLSPLATLSPRFRLFPLPPSVQPETYFRESCRVGSSDDIAGRPARSLTCGNRDFQFTLWLDQESGLLLKLATPGTVLEVRSIEFDVRFAPADFLPEPPPGATVVRIGGRG